MPHSITQLGPGDVSPPRVLAASLSATSVDRGAGEPLTVTMRIVDARAGLASGTLCFEHAGNGATTCMGVPATRVSGDAHDGVYRAAVPLPDGDAALGRWRARPLWLADAADNDAEPYAPLVFRVVS